MATAPNFPLTADGCRATHRHLFQDIFDWAGELRTVQLAKGSTAFPPRDWMEASIRSFHGDEEPKRRIIAQGIGLV